MNKKIKLIISGVVFLVVAVVAVVLCIFFLKGKDTEMEYASEQQQIMYELYDFDCAMAEIVSEYDFEGDIEANLAEWDAFGEEFEVYMDKQIEAGVLKYYTEGLCCYAIGFENGFEFILEAPFELEGIMAGGGGVNKEVEEEAEEILLLAQNDVESSNTKDLDEPLMQGRILTMEPLTGVGESTKTIVESAMYAANSEHNYEVVSYNHKDCNDFYKLMDIMKSWGQYDMVVLESHGQSVEIPNFSGTRDHRNGGVGYYHYVQLADSIDYLDYMAYTMNNFFPEMDKHRVTLKAYAGGNWREATEEEVNSTLYHIFDLEAVSDNSSTKMSAADKYLLSTEEKITGKKKYFIPAKVGLYVRDEWFREFYSQYPLERAPIIYLSSCFAGQGDENGQALLDVGAGAVMCYYEAVVPSYHADMFREIMKQLTSYSQNDNPYNVEDNRGKYNTLMDSIYLAKEVLGETCDAYTTWWRFYLSEGINKLTNSNKGGDIYDEYAEQCYLKVFTNDYNIRLPLYNGEEEIVDDEYYSGGIGGEFDSFGEIEYELVEGQIPQEYAEFCDKVISLLDNGDLAGFESYVYPIGGKDPILDVTISMGSRGDYGGFHLPDGRVLLVADMGERQLCLLGYYSDGYLKGPWKGFRYTYTFDGEIYSFEESFAYAYIDETTGIAQGICDEYTNRYLQKNRVWKCSYDNYEYSQTVYDEYGNLNEDETKTSERGIADSDDWQMLSIDWNFGYGTVDYYGYGTDLSDRIVWVN